MSPKEFHRRWRRRLAALEEDIVALFEKCRVTGGPDTIHDLRVAIRRARLYAHLGRPLLRKSPLRRFDEWARTTNDLLGPMRDCDVCMSWLATHPDSLDAVQLIRDERLRLWGQAVAVLNRRKSDFRGGMVLRKNEKGAPQDLSRRYHKELKRLVRTVTGQASRTRQMKPEELHDLRRQLRRWRYLRELSLSKRVHRTEPLLGWLIAVQDALGESQNLQMAVTLFRKHSEWQKIAHCIDLARSEQARWIARARKALSKIPGPID